MWSTEKAKIKFEYEANAFYEDDECIYVVTSEDIICLPYTEHNLSLCRRQVIEKLEQIKEVYQEVQNMRESFDLIDNIHYLLTVFRLKRQYQYISDITYLYENMKQVQEKLHPVVLDFIPDYDDMYMIESDLEEENLLRVTPEQAHKYVKQMKKFNVGKGK